MLAQDLMRTDVSVVPETASAEYAARLMRDENVGFLPVVSDDEDSRRLVGVITDRDLAMAVMAENLVPRDVAVGLIATRVIITAMPHEDLAEIERKMATAEVRRLPVVNDRGDVIGVISIHDLAQLESEERTGEVFREVSKTSARDHSDVI